RHIAAAAGRQALTDIHAENSSGGDAVGVTGGGGDHRPDDAFEYTLDVLVIRVGGDASDDAIDGDVAQCLSRAGADQESRSGPAEIDRIALINPGSAGVIEGDQVARINRIALVQLVGTDIAARQPNRVAGDVADGL